MNKQHTIDEYLKKQTIEHIVEDVLCGMVFRDVEDYLDFKEEILDSFYAEEAAKNYYEAHKFIEKSMRARVEAAKGKERKILEDNYNAWLMLCADKGIYFMDAGVKKNGGND